jgi:hypothetical protein
MPLLSWDDTDRLIAAAYRDGGTRLSDYTQLLDAVKAIDDWFKANHGAATGVHASTCGAADWTGYDDASTAPTQTITHTTGGSPGAVAIEAGSWPDDRNRAMGGLHRALAGSGVVELLPVWIGSEISSGEIGSLPSIGTRRISAGSGNMTIYGYRLPVYSPECCGPAHSDYVSENGALGSPSDANAERLTRARFTSQDTLVHTYKDAVSKSLYRQIWRLAKSLWDAIRYEHTAAGVSFPPSPARLYGRASIPVHNLCAAEEFSASRQLLVGAHAGVHQFVMPWIRLVKYTSPIVVANQCQWVIVPAFDDENVYLDVQPVGYSAVNDEAIWQFTAHASMQPDTLPAAGTLPSLDTATNAELGHSITLAHWKQLHDGLRRYKLLYQVEHDFPSGGHRYPISRMDGATKVFDAEITAPSTIGDVGYTPSSATAGSNPASSYTDITQTEIDASPPAGGGIYIPSLVGAAGSGICTVTIAASTTKTYAIIRRKTAGTSNSFTLRVWRINP